MMKKWLIAGCLALTMTCSLTALASPAKKANPDSQQWILLAKSPKASFYCDDASLQPIPRNVAPKDIVLMDAKAKVEVSDKNFVDFVKASSEKGKKSPDWNYLLLDFQLNLADRTYKCTSMDMFNDQNKLVERRKIKQKFLPVPKKTFVEMMWNKGQEKAVDLQTPSNWVALDTPYLADRTISYNEQGFSPVHLKAEPDALYMSAQYKECAKDGSPLKMLPGGDKRSDVTAVVTNVLFCLGSENYTVTGTEFYGEDGKLLQKNTIKEKFFPVNSGHFMETLYNKAMNKAAEMGYTVAVG